MAFPISPVDGQLYTTSIGIVYQYQSATDRWLLYSHTIVGETGAQGFTGAQGVTGLIGAQGITGLIGATGALGLSVTSGTANPPSPTGYPENAIYIQYVAY